MAKNLAPKSYYTLQEVAAYWAEKYDMQLSADDLVHYGSEGDLTLYVLARGWVLEFTNFEFGQSGAIVNVPFASHKVDGPLAIGKKTAYEIEKSGCAITKYIKPEGPVIEDLAAKGVELDEVVKGRGLINIKGRLDLNDYTPSDDRELSKDEIYVAKDKLHVIDRDVREFEATHFAGLGTAQPQKSKRSDTKNHWIKIIMEMAQLASWRVDEDALEEMDEGDLCHETALIGKELRLWHKSANAAAEWLEAETERLRNGGSLRDKLSQAKRAAKSLYDA